MLGSLCAQSHTHKAKTRKIQSTTLQIAATAGAGAVVVVGGGMARLAAGTEQAQG